ncbi:MAG: ParB/RepB/Spo0J family partition protein [Succinivibrio sp.]|jgi:ParB/RepB/Spo0J family partition protein|nr:ParB/RepB/Spo0J family partition protein [Succinivibrio sp.]MCI6449126.1 ParB/RepB/Spo0J family partition protein [Succinivibrio sp.]MCI7773034.1 ParB/RepB/Spo0J family partition protein [Succinivibrio sp.]MDD7288005.1 ParB/RepB/Spo0J family partition protein [Succinivibrio sp.]MDY3108394.1 ParB/RepB/Spo0J family partition protein [Succinivibrio sp.]
MAGLGRGLDSLLSESKKNREEKVRENEVSQPLNTISQDILTSEKNKIVELPISILKPSIYQPRKNFDKESLEELSLSIKEHGLLEPLLVKKSDEDKYEIICGERRYRACKLANLENVPCLIRDDLGDNGYAVALIENIQREDLNPLEMAQAFNLMLEECKLSQEDLAKTLGKSRSSIANIVRLNNLQEDVKKMILANQIDLGHAKVLLSLDDPNLQLKAALYVIKKSLSVRQTEQLVKNIKLNNTEELEPTSTKEKVENNFGGLEEELNQKFSGIKFKFKATSEEKGKITLSYSSKEQLDNLLAFLKQE